MPDDKSQTTACPLYGGPPTIQIKHRWSGAALFECEMPPDVAAMDDRSRLGFAVKEAVKGKANLGGTNLSGADLSGANLSGANLSGADLSGANLFAADLRGASLRDADLSDAKLFAAKLRGANLVAANLRCASLSGADLSGANLRGADLSDADLSGADLSGANLSGADLSGAKWRDDITITRAPICISGLAYPIYVLDQHMQIGCELHTLTEWAAFDDDYIAHMDGIASRRFWNAHRDFLLALAASDKRNISAPEVDTP